MEPEDLVPTVAEIVDETQWDTVLGIVRPRLILLNAWLDTVEERGIAMATVICDDDWATDLLVAAGAPLVEAMEYVQNEWW